MPCEALKFEVKAYGGTGIVSSAVAFVLHPSASCEPEAAQVSNFNLTQIQCATSWEFVTMEPEVPAVSFGLVLALQEFSFRM